MAWETRNGKGPYYTRSRRVNGRVVREYIGTGPQAEQAAQEDEDARIEKALRAAAWKAEKETVESLDGALESLDQGCDHLLAFVLEQAGYHYHRGEWRKYRGTPQA
jgi:hypothetical protein